MQLDAEGPSGLTKVFDRERRPHLSPQPTRARPWFVGRGAGYLMTLIAMMKMMVAIIQQDGLVRRQPRRAGKMVALPMPAYPA